MLNAPTAFGQRAVPPTLNDQRITEMEGARAVFAEHAKQIYKRDVATELKPYVLNAPLYEEIKHCLASMIFSRCPGTLVVLAPREAGKSTQAIEAGQALKKFGIIADFAVGSLLGLKDASPTTFVKHQLGGESLSDRSIDVDDIIPSEAKYNKPALVIDASSTAPRA